MFALLILIMLPTVNGFLVADMFVPALPEISQSFAVDSVHIKLSITLYLITLTLSQLFYGPLADRFGRRLMMISGLIISLFGALLCMFATSIEMFILGRLIQGIGMGAPMCLGRTIFSDIFSGKRFAQVAAYYSIIFALAPAVAPFLGGYMAHWFGWRSIFVFIFFYGVFASLMVIAFLPESSRSLHVDATRIKTVFKNYFNLICHREFMVYAISTGVAISGIIVYYTISPFLLRDILGLSTVEYGWLTLLITAAMLLGRGLNAFCLKYSSIAQLVQIGNGIMALSGLSMLLLGALGWINTFVIVAPMFLFVFGGGFVFSNAMAAALAPFRGKMGGVAGALYGSIQILSAFLASLVAAFLDSSNQVGMAALLFMLGLFAVVLFYYTIVRHPGLER